MYLIVDDMKKHAPPNLKKLQHAFFLLSSPKLLGKVACREKLLVQDRSLAATGARAALAVAGQMERPEIVGQHILPVDSDTPCAVIPKSQKYHDTVGLFYLKDQQTVGMSLVN